MFKKLASVAHSNPRRNFATYYRLQDSFFNFAVNIPGKPIIDGNTRPKVFQMIENAYNAGVTRFVVHLKENNDEKDVVYITKKLEQLKNEQFPKMEIQGFRYPMMFNQKKRLFLHNEFLFGLKASQMIGTRLFPHSFFFVESNEFFRSAINPEDKIGYDKALFNLDILEDAQRSLEFANLVFLLKYDDGQADPENLKKFFDVYQKKNIAIDFRLNQAFLKEPTEDKKKNTTDLVKYAYGFEPRLKGFYLYDYVYDQETKKIKNVDVGEGIIDFKLIFDLVKMSHFQGVLIFPAETSTLGIQKLIERVKQSGFQEQDENQILQYIQHKEDQEKRKQNQLGSEMFLEI